MKKAFLIALLCLASIFVLALVSCGGGDDTTTAAPETEPPSPTEGLVALTSEGESVYRVVIPSDWRDTMVTDTVELLASRVAEDTGAALTVSYDTSAVAEREIIVGLTSREDGAAEAKELAPRDWLIKVADDRIYILGGTMYSTCLALDAFMEELFLWEGELYVGEDCYLDFIYERDNTEDVYGTLDEKLAQFGDPNGRLMVTSHRAENVNNPENSLSAIAAAVALGADILELDVTKTKDGHYVLMHDSTLTRTTNVAQFAGKNGYPSSHNVSDWTLEQIRALTLNGSKFNETVPTLEEALILVRGRAIFDFDKTTSEADRLAVYRIAVKLRAVDSVMYQGGSLSHNVMKTIYAETGIALPYLYNAGTFSDARSYILNTYKDVEYARQAIQITTSVPPSYALELAETCRLWMNTLGWSSDPTGPEVHADNPTSWKRLFDGGISVIQTDQPYKLLSYVQNRESGSGVEWTLTYSTEPVKWESRASLLFNCSRAGDIYYTTDGSEPIAEGDPLKGNILIDDTATVKVLFVAADGSEYRFDVNVLAGCQEFYDLIGITE